jgi:ketosteroid isomerase-like protein
LSSTPGILVFDLAPPLQYAGKDAYRKNFEEWFASFQGSIGYAIRSLTISAGADVAFAHSLNHISGTRTDSEKTDVWVRATETTHRDVRRRLLPPDRDRHEIAVSDCSDCGATHGLTA